MGGGIQRRPTQTRRSSRPIPLARLGRVATLPGSARDTGRAMSQENVDAMRRGLEAWRGGDVKTVGALMEEFIAPEFEIEPLYFDGSYRGHEGLGSWVGPRDFWDEYRLETGELLDLGDHVLATSRVTGRGRGSGVPVARACGSSGRSPAREPFAPSRSRRKPRPSKPPGRGSRRCRRRTWSWPTGL